MTTAKHFVSLNFADLNFPAGDDDGRNVTAAPGAVTLARELLNAPPEAELLWNLPDVFAVAYGSTFIGTCAYLDNVIEFHFEE